MIELIPAVDIIDGKCVRLCQGDYNRKSVYDYTPSEMVKRFADAGLRRIHAVDLEGAKAGEPVNLPALESMANAVSDVKIEWGGGLTSRHALEQARDAGMHYAVIGCLATRQPNLFAEWLKEFGNEMMVLGADVKEGKVAVSGWLESSSFTVQELISRFREYGLTQSIVTQIACDGMLQGPDFPLYTQLQEEFPEIAFTVSGGVSSIHDLEKAEQLGLKRINVGKAVYEGRITLKEMERFAI